MFIATGTGENFVDGFYFIFYYYLIWLQMGFTQWQWQNNKTQYKNTHITQNNTRSNKTQHTKLHK
jgi:hypothetical protein